MNKNNESIRLFANPILERLTHSHPLTLTCIFSVIIVCSSYAAIMHRGVIGYILGFVIGVLLWTFMEYGIHRFVYHFEPKNIRAKRFFFLMHGIHHEAPHDVTRLVTPPALGVPVSVFIFIVYHWIFAVNFEAIFAGTMFAYLGYDLVHFSVHHFNWKNRVFKYLKQYHFSHHYLDGHRAFGVSSPLWDLIFNTRPLLQNQKSV